MKTKELALLYKGNEFFMKVLEGGLISLTDLWRGEGAVNGKRPDGWLHLAETAEFLVACLNAAASGILPERPAASKESGTALKRWAESIIKECEKQGMIKRVSGRNGGTYAHRQIALSYAGYLSPELRVLVQQVFIERLEETVDPELGISRSRKRAVKLWLDKGKSQEWIAERIEGIDKRNELTSVLGSHGVYGQGYGTCTNAIYIPVLHGPAADVKKKMNLPAKANLRDSLGERDLASIKFAETIAKLNIQAADSYGTEACAREANRAGEAVKVALMMAKEESTRGHIR